MHRIAWRRAALGHPWLLQHIQRHDDVKTFEWPVLNRTRDAVFAHLLVAPLPESAWFFFAGGCLGLIPGGAPFSQLSSGVKDAMVVFTRLVKCQLMTKTCRKAG